MTLLEGRQPRESLVGITSEKMQWETEFVDSFTQRDGGITDYLTRTVVKLEERQKPLYDYLFYEVINDVVEDEFMFTSGFAFIFNILSDEQLEEELSSEEIETFKQSLDEHAVEGEDGPYFDFGWCFEKLAEYEPITYAFLESLDVNEEEEVDFEDFSLGVMFTAMPFILRAEAQLLSQHLSGEAAS